MFGRKEKIVALSLAIMLTGSLRAMEKSNNGSKFEFPLCHIHSDKHEDAYFLEIFTDDKICNHDRSMVVRGRGNGMVELLGQNPLRVLHAWKAHDKPVIYANFSPSGKRIITVSADHKAKVWTIDGALLFTIQDNKTPIHLATFGESDARVIINYINNANKILLVPTDELLNPQTQNLKSYVDLVSEYMTNLKGERPSFQNFVGNFLVGKYAKDPDDQYLRMRLRKMEALTFYGLDAGTQAYLRMLIPGRSETYDLMRSRL
jgi:WD40 repeat protein